MVWEWSIISGVFLGSIYSPEWLLQSPFTLPSHSLNFLYFLSTLATDTLITSNLSWCFESGLVQPRKCTSKIKSFSGLVWSQVSLSPKSARALQKSPNSDFPRALLNRYWYARMLWMTWGQKSIFRIMFWVKRNFPRRRSAFSGHHK